MGKAKYISHLVIFLQAAQLLKSKKLIALESPDWARLNKICLVYNTLYINLCLNDCSTDFNI